MVGETSSNGIYVEQGKSFSISFECLDQNGKVCKNGKYEQIRYFTSIE